MGAFSTPRRQRLHDVLSGHVEFGEVPGIVALLWRRGETHVGALGRLALAGGEPMRRDSSSGPSSTG